MQNFYKLRPHYSLNLLLLDFSDDRSPDVFLNKIETTTQMKAVLGASKKPNCLIIDEIDGAPGVWLRSSFLLIILANYLSILSQPFFGVIGKVLLSVVTLKSLFFIA